jgi:hypothetical protein
VLDGGTVTDSTAVVATTEVGTDVVGAGSRDEPAAEHAAGTLSANPKSARRDVPFTVP